MPRSYGGRTLDERLEMTAVSPGRWVVRDLRFPASDPRAVVGVVDVEGGSYRVAWMQRGERMRCRTLIDVLVSASGVLDRRPPDE